MKISKRQRDLIRKTTLGELTDDCFALPKSEYPEVNHLVESIHTLVEAAPTHVIKAALTLVLSETLLTLDKEGL